MIVRDARLLKFNPEQPVFFDTNVWLSIYPATSNETDKDWAKDYSELYARLTKYDVQIIVNAIVISEYINRFCRIEHEVYCKTCKYIEYKDFRNSSDFAYVAKAAAESASEILGTSSVSLKAIEGDLDVPGCISEFESGSIDFNDSVFVATCIKNGWPIVTNDSDFVNSGRDIEIWTTNNSILKEAKKNEIYISQ